MLEESWTELDWIDRLSLAVTLPCVILFTVILVARRFVNNYNNDKTQSQQEQPPNSNSSSSSSNNNNNNSKLVKISENVYQIYYSVPLAGCNATVLRDPKTNHLLVHSPPPCCDAGGDDDSSLIRQINKLGEVKVVVCPSPAHDTHSPAWKRRFSNSENGGGDVVLMTHPAAKDELGYDVDTTYDETHGKKLLRQFGVVDVIDIGDLMRFPDSLWLVRIGSDTTVDASTNNNVDPVVLLTSCGFVGGRDRHLPAWLHYFVSAIGIGPKRFTRHGSLVYLKDVAALKERFLRSCRDAELILFQHGEPVEASEAANILFTRNPFRNTFS